MPDVISVHPRRDPAAADPADLSVLEAARLLRAGALSAVELTEACLDRIEERNGVPPTLDGTPDQINAWMRLYPELAREQAARADERRGAEPEAAPLLCGIPIAVKDLYAVAGLPLTASSRVLEGNVPDHDSTAWARLRADGMVLLGHTHTHEFGAGGANRKPCPASQPSRAMTSSWVVFSIPFAIARSSLARTTPITALKIRAVLASTVAAAVMLRSILTAWRG